MRQMDNNCLELDYYPKTVLALENNQISSQNGIVRQKEDFYKWVSELFDKNPQILELAHEDLQALNKGKASSSKNHHARGRKVCYCSKSLFRAVFVKKCESSTCRNITFLLAQSPILHNFCQLGDQH